MLVRACCLNSLLLLLACGCQTPNTALFPWQGDSSKPGLTEAELNRNLDGPSVNEDAFGASTSTDDKLASSQADSSSDQDRRMEQWLNRGQEAIRQAADSPHRAQLLKEATESFLAVLRLDEDNADAFHGLAIVSDLSEDWELAEMNYKRALSVRRDDVNLLNDLGYSYLLQQRYDEASHYLSRVIQIDPRHEKAHINLAILQVQKGNHESARMQLAQIYRDERVQSALAGIIQEHGLLASNGDVSTRAHQQPAVPPQFPENGQPETAQRLAAPSQPAMTAQAASAARSQQQLSVPQQWNGNSSSQQESLFAQNGLITAPAPQSPVQPVVATSDQVWQQATVTAIPQSSGRTQQQTSPGRRIGQVVELPVQTTVIRPRLPASANVYNPVARPTPQTGGVPAQPVAQSLPGPMPPAMNQLQSAPPQYQQPLQDHRPVSVLPQQMQGASGVPGGTYFPNQPPMNSYPQQPAQVRATGSFYGQPGQQTGQPPMYSPNPAGQTGAINQSMGAHTTPSGNMSGVSSPNSPQQRYPQFHGTPAQPSSYQQPVGGVQPLGAGSAQQATNSGPGQQTRGPQYFAPAPLSVPGFHDPVRTAPDRLAEYRAERQQQENEYQQTLQNFARPLGGNSFQ